MYLGHELSASIGGGGEVTVVLVELLLLPVLTLTRGFSAVTPDTEIIISHIRVFNSMTNLIKSS